MKFEWRPVDGFAYNLARQCDTSIGRLTVKRGRGHTSRSYLVRLEKEVLSSHEPSLPAAMFTAESVVKSRLGIENPSDSNYQPAFTSPEPAGTHPAESLPPQHLRRRAFE